MSICSSKIENKEFLKKNQIINTIIKKILLFSSTCVLYNESGVFETEFEIVFGLSTYLLGTIPLTRCV